MMKVKINSKKGLKTSLSVLVDKKTIEKKLFNFINNKHSLFISNFTCFLFYGKFFIQQDMVFFFVAILSFF